MKNRSIVSLILLAILAPSCGSGGGGGGGGSRGVTVPRWAETFRRPTSVDLRAVRFGNPSNGIAAGKYGTFVRTDDGGNTWYQLEHSPASGSGDVLAMSVGGITTVAAGSTPAGGPATDCVAWQSFDATSFSAPESVPSSFLEPWVDIALVVEGGKQSAPGTLRLRPSGFVDAYQGSLIVTLDSTRNVQNATPPPVPPTPWTSANGLFVFGTSGQWFVCGNNGGNAQIRRTVTDGQDFTTLNVPAATPPLRRITFTDQLTGFTCGDSNTVLYTTNTVDWVALPNKPALPAGNLRALAFTSPSLGFAVGDGGRIYRLRFTSMWNWEVQTSGTTEDLYDVTFADSNTVYAVGNNGTVVKCANASAASGLTWALKSGPAANPIAVFNAVGFTQDGVIGLAAGNGGVLYRTLDGGLTWTLFNSGVGVANLTAVSIPRSGTGTVAFVGTDTGAVFVHSALQAGGSWTAGTGTSPGAIKSILFPKDDSTGVATGAAGSFARLSYVNPGGLTVTSQALVPAQAGTNYAAAADPTGDLIYLAGDNGYLVESANSGLTWAAVTPAPPNVSLRGLQVPMGPAYRMYAAASNGDVHRLSTGASPAWSATAGAVIGTPVALAFSDGYSGMVVTQGATSGGVYYTTDGGTLWTKSVLHVPVDAGAHVLNGAWVNPGRTGFVVGSNGLIMRTTTLGE